MAEPEMRPADERTRDTRSRWTTAEAVALLGIVLPAVGYAAAYQFRQGQFKAMGLPLELLSLELRDVAAGCIAVSAVVAVLLGFSTFFGLLASAEDASEIERSLVNTLAPTVPFVLLYFLAGQLTTLGWVVLLAGIGLLVAGEFVPPLLTQRKVKGLEAKLKAYHKHGETDLRPTRLMRFEGEARKAVFFGAAAIMLVNSASPVGAAVTRARDQYAIIESNPQRVVVSSFNGSLVTLTYDPESRAAGSPVTVLKSEDATAGLYLTRTGPLKFTGAR